MSAAHSHTAACNHDHHDHDHAHGGGHGGGELSDRKMALAVAVTLLFVAGEILAGVFGHSLALISDAGHNFADAAALGFSWYALRIAQKPAAGGNYPIARWPWPSRSRSCSWRVKSSRASLATASR